MKNSFETIKNALTQHGTFAVEGEHGIGKTHMLRLAAEEFGLNYEILTAPLLYAEEAYGYRLNPLYAHEVNEKLKMSNANLIIFDEVNRAELAVLEGIFNFQKENPHVRVVYSFTEVQDEYATTTQVELFKYLKNNRIAIINL